MRIVEEFNIDHYRCTVFQHNMKYSLQVEDEKYLIQFKLGNMTLDKVNHIRDTLNLSKLKYQLVKSFSQVHDTRIIMDRLLDSGEEAPLPEII